MWAFHWKWNCARVTHHFYYLRCKLSLLWCIVFPKQTLSFEINNAHLKGVETQSNYGTFNKESESWLGTARASADGQTAAIAHLEPGWKGQLSLSFPRIVVSNHSVAPSVSSFCWCCALKEIRHICSPPRASWLAFASSQFTHGASYQRER